MDMKDGGSAFPMLEAWKENADLYCPDRGMTLHQYYIGQALVGLCVNHSLNDVVTNKDIAVEACNIADAVIAMLAERERQG